MGPSCDASDLLDDLGLRDCGWRDAYLRAVVADLEGGEIDMFSESVRQWIDVIWVAYVSIALVVLLKRTSK